MEAKGRGTGTHTRNRNFAVALLMICLSACFHDDHSPTANAGSDQIVNVGDTVTLDGGNSSDVDGDRLRYAWSFVEKPQNSEAVITNQTSRTANFSADKIGDYVVQLVVSDGDNKSKPDFVHIMTRNRVPNAVAIATGGTTIGIPVQLDGSGSSDPDGQPLFFQWEIVLKPENSAASITQPTNTLTQFTPDVPGAYIVHLTVNDGEHPSQPMMLIVNIAEPVRQFNGLPLAEAGNDVPLEDLGPIQLDGSKSSDPNNDPLTYRWTLLLKPETSAAALSDETSATPTLNIDVMGSYVAQLVVNDGTGDSHADTVVATPHTNPQLACQDCHNGAMASGKSTNHLLTYDDCAHCHFTTRWKLTQGRFHAHGHMARPFACDLCHSGNGATGKSSDHIQTSLDCNHCHTLNATTWLPALFVPEDPVFDHEGIFSGCADCHDGIDQTGKPSGHVPVSNRCNACHDTTSWLPAVHLEHLQPFDNRCQECHTEQTPVRKPANHPATSGLCSSCHSAFGFKPVLKVDHTQLTGTCIECHSLEAVTLTQELHLGIQAGTDCATCHSTARWTPAESVHQAYATNCKVCHSRTIAGGQPANHIPATLVCEACHASTMWTPVLAVDHSQHTVTCDSCHDGKVASRRPVSHLATSDFCARCHATTSFVPNILFDHAQSLGDCVVCHNGIYKNGKSPNHITSSDGCTECHGGSVWIPVKPTEHAKLATNCVGCHQKSIDHVASVDTCESCHLPSVWGAIIEPFDHQSLVESVDGCVRCHDGAFRNGKLSQHLPTSDKCGACHATEFWTPVIVFDHNEKGPVCFACHNNTLATGKYPGHISSTVDCAACHSNAYWVPVAAVDHTRVIGNCVDCHDGAMIDIKPYSHKSFTDNCGACHETSLWNPPRFIDHSQLLVGTCETCHLTPATHTAVKVTTACGDCHHSQSWLPARRPLGAAQ